MAINVPNHIGGGEFKNFPFYRKPIDLDICETSSPNSITMRKRRKGAFEGTFFI